MAVYYSNGDCFKLSSERSLLDIFTSNSIILYRLNKRALLLSMCCNHDCCFDLFFCDMKMNIAQPFINRIN